MRHERRSSAGRPGGPPRSSMRIRAHPVDSGPRECHFRSASTITLPIDRHRPHVPKGFPTVTSAPETAETAAGPSLRQRVDDLLSRLTRDERVAMLHQYAPAVPRLGLAAFRTGTEALHGVAWLGPATV